MENDARNGREMGNGTGAGRIVSARGGGKGGEYGAGSTLLIEHRERKCSNSLCFAGCGTLCRVSEENRGQREGKSVLSRTERGKAARGRGRREGERSQDILEAVACAETAT